MPTYVYETIPESASATPQRFEVRQSMSEPALTRHPQTGAPVRRVITGGTGLMGGSSSSPAARPSSGIG
jgi:predicted nucleic acid-binding Zn ribbon protein